MALLAEFCEGLFAFLDGLFLPLYGSWGLLGSLQSDAAGYGSLVPAYIMEYAYSAVAANEQIFSACIKFHVVD